MNAEILSITARQVYTRRPSQGVEAIVKTASGVGRAVCTAGTSVGTHEVAFKYDNSSKWHGKGVGKRGERGKPLDRAENAGIGLFGPKPGG